MCRWRVFVTLGALALATFLPSVASARSGLHAITPLRVVLVIDDSASEFGAHGTDPGSIRYRAATIAAQILAAAARTGTHVELGVVHFGSHAPASRALGLTALPAGLQRALSAIGSPKNLGITNFPAALARAQRFLAVTKDGGRPVVLLFSDGQPFVPGQNLATDWRRITDQVMSSPARIDLFGIDRTGGFAAAAPRWRPLTTCTDAQLRATTPAAVTERLVATLACEGGMTMTALACSLSAASPGSEGVSTTLARLCSAGAGTGDFLMPDTTWSLIASAVVLLVLLGLLFMLPVGRAGFGTSFLHDLIVGTDNRTSTSKCVSLAWALLIFYCLVALVIAHALGASQGWDQLVKTGLSPAYLLVAGAPFAAAVLAKVAATRKAATGGKTMAVPGSSTPSQLVTNDSGTPDLGDIQYVVFNAVAFVYVLVNFLAHSQSGLPAIPRLLIELPLASATAYVAKQAFADLRPTLTSVTPKTVRKGDSFGLRGTNLVVPHGTTDASGTPTTALPDVIVGGAPATVERVLGTGAGNDQLTVTLGPGTFAGPDQPLIVQRFDGLVARADPGMQAAITVTPSSTDNGGVDDTALRTLLALTRIATMRDG